jgi:hypothetical protein
MAWTVHTLLNCLEKPHKPDADYLISLRKDFFVCASILACRCYGMREMERSQPIAHFRQTEWLDTVSAQ